MKRTVRDQKNHEAENFQEIEDLSALMRKNTEIHRNSRSGPCGIIRWTRKYKYFFGLVSGVMVVNRMNQEKKSGTLSEEILPTYFEKYKIC